MSHKYVYLFNEGNATMRNLLGGKGANLAEMTGLGLPVPYGFTVSTEKQLLPLPKKRRAKNSAAPKTPSSFPFVPAHVQACPA